eukprot:CAMPEP_0201703148 /NCGR_PEP_ID=MMETSP0578-20130828/38784_1 /ASSEMBLY_ACC=CAM_ASM_000663 /TAXON_ID=267565 /ORGANISM="Skeletonema grethea, Strain CCMP 1804" /LENGTH=215 /DNA_ID=CAMNT_0048190873 /DNA_START=9 /DNA_END=656 /DNA_ORIENTATION=+
MSAHNDKEDGATTTVAVTADDVGVEVGISGGDRKTVIGSLTHDKSALYTETNNNNAVEDRALDILQRPTRNNSPKSHLEFDIKATTSDDNKQLNMNHSHDAYEIQHKTQAMRDLDVLVGDDLDDEVEPAKVTFALDVVLDDEKKKERKSKRRINRQAKQKEPRHGEWLFSCTMDDIDEVVEDLVSPFDGITDFITCHQGDDEDSIVDKGEKGVEL